MISFSRPVVLASLLINAIFSAAQAGPNIAWQKCLGGSQQDAATSFKITTDGGFIVLGNSYSNDGNVSGNHGGSDIWVVKLDVNGSIQWQRALGGTANDGGLDVIQTSDGGYLVGGSTLSVNGDVTINLGSSDCWVVKLDQNGSIQWQHVYGGSGGGEGVTKIQATVDGDYVLAGGSRSTDGDISAPHGLDDIWVFKINAQGELLWERSFGGSLLDYLGGFDPTLDGGYILTGTSTSADGDLTNNQGITDAWVLKIDSSGNLIWQHSYGGSLEDRVRKAIATPDGGYLIVGETHSNDGDITVAHGDADAWIIKLDANGELIWQKTIGGSLEDTFISAERLWDGNFLFIGSTRSINGDVSNNFGELDLWFVRADSVGTIIWEQNYGGTDLDVGRDLRITPEGNYVVLGGTRSNDTDVSSNHGDLDLWLVKFDTDFTAINEYASNQDLQLYPNPTNGPISVELDTYSGSPIFYQWLDQNGKNCGSGRIGNTQNGPHTVHISTNDLPTGVYQLTILLDGKKLVKEVVKL